MGGLDRQVLAERAAAIERHLERVQTRLPADAEDFGPSTDASDAVVLHLWQAVQLTIDLALAACLHLKLGTPENYGDAFIRLAGAGHLDDALARRLVRAAEEGPADLRAFLGVVGKLV